MGTLIPPAPARRPLRVEAPQVHWVTTPDGTRIRLTRHRGGARGPVLLTHGLGVSSRIFTTDTIAVNLLEALFARGFDVWLVDLRASIELESAPRAATADDIAREDYPAAVRHVRQLTGAPSVQVVAHCYGSTTFLMAMLTGLEGVRSAVCSQATTHLDAPRMTRLKAGLHVPELLEALGVKTMTAYVDAHPNWMDRLYDAALRLQPLEREERCSSPICHRITFLYSILYEHDQLHPQTHEALGELFGVANIHALDHLCVMVRKGHLVNARGEDVYLPHLERLAVPILFVHGEENACFLPSGSERAVDLLARKNGTNLYRRAVIPRYGHIDCIFGKDAARDVYPTILEHLEGT